MTATVITKPKVRMSSIKFRHKIHSIQTKEELVNCKGYLTQFLISRFWSKIYVDGFLEPVFNDAFDIDTVKLGLLRYGDALDDPIDEPETSLYKFLCLNYSNQEGINETFHDFYEKYRSAVVNSLSKNHVSRALNALGLKPIMKKIKIDDPKIPGEKKVKCVMVLHATKKELSEIFKKNFK